MTSSQPVKETSDLTKCPYLDCRAVFPAVDEGGVRSFADGRILKGLCPNCHRRASFKPLHGIERLEKLHGEMEQKPLPITQLSVLLDDVRSLWNVGSIFRTADGAGFETIYLCGITGCPPRKEIAKTSLGAEDHLLWNFLINPLHVLPSLREKGVFILGLEKTSSSIDLGFALSQSKLKRPLCMIVGNEVSGLSEESLSMCDLVCHLPMKGFKESLNVAVAFGIAAYMISNAPDID